MEDERVCIECCEMICQNSVYTWFVRLCNFGLLLLFLNILTLSHFRRIYYVYSLYHDFVLHSWHETWTCEIICKKINWRSDDYFRILVFFLYYSDALFIFLTLKANISIFKWFSFLPSYQDIHILVGHKVHSRWGVSHISVTWPCTGVYYIQWI
jgi:hypothetical protein